MQKIKSSFTTLFSLLVAYVLFSATTYAQQPLLPCDEQEQKIIEATAADEVQLITSFTPAKPIERISARYPKNAARKGAEGWVQLSFVVDENGDVQNPIVEDSGGHKSFERAAMSAVKRWQYEPAIKNGKPTEICNQKIMLDFTLAGNEGASRKFIKQYKIAEELVQNNDLTGAEAAIDSLHKMDNLNRYENAWLWNVDAIYSGKIENHKRQLISIKRLISSSRMHEKNVFNDAHMGVMHQRLAVLQVMLAHYADAHDTIEKIKELPEGEQLLAQITNLTAHVEEVASSGKNIAVSIELDQESAYFHKLLRNNFAFANINGELNKVEVWCDSKREVFTVAEDHIWKIPESWGQCRVLVSGEKNTQFELIEVGKV
jgi:TonB family protein